MQHEDKEPEPPSTPATGDAQHVHHSIDYIEFSVTDIGAATAFYTAAFGWQFIHYGPNYAGIQANGREVGGLHAEGTVVVGSSLVVLFSRDLNATLEAVRTAGGSIVKEPYAFPGGRRFHFKDPSGNELAVWSHT
jgi:hypothetical protein